MPDYNTDEISFIAYTSESGEERRVPIDEISGKLRGYVTTILVHDRFNGMLLGVFDGPEDDIRAGIDTIDGERYMLEGECLEADGQIGVYVPSIRAIMKINDI